MLNVKKDTESLIEHRDPSSFRSLFTGKGSKYSIEFEFDDILQATKVYGSWTRSLLKRQVRNQVQDSTTSGKEPHEDRSGDVPPGRRHVMTRPSSSAGNNKEAWAQRWQRATGQLDKRRMRKRCRFLLLGASNSDRVILMMLLAISCQKEPSLEQLGRYRPAIYKALIDNIKLLLETLRGLHTELVPGIDAGVFHTILQYDTSGPVHHMDERFLATLTTLWGLPGLLTALE